MKTNLNCLFRIICQKLTELAKLPLKVLQVKFCTNLRVRNYIIFPNFLVINCLRLGPSWVVEILFVVYILSAWPRGRVYSGIASHFGSKRRC
ncbi:unnamed protein product [Moneuplotes crassus]|uniref:Uncharacterized protein n=1 Tax=Euplotes crassus TaxID=5936 RepID=A0AAD1XSY7_EUPCR|nr:unnamed protein product [Moneuplotes crassus]